MGLSGPLLISEGTELTPPQGLAMSHRVYLEGSRGTKEHGGCEGSSEAEGGQTPTQGRAAVPSPPPPPVIPLSQVTCREWGLSRET